MAVDLDGGDRRTGVGEGEGERAQAGADLDDRLARLHAGEARDAAHRVGIGHEVLAERPAGAETVTVEQLADLAAAQQAPFQGRLPCQR